MIEIFVSYASTTNSTYVKYQAEKKRSYTHEKKNPVSGRCDAIQFCVDKRVFIVGLGLYGSSNGSSDYSAKIELKKSNGSLLASNVQQFFSDGKTEIIFIVILIQTKIYFIATGSSTTSNANALLITEGGVNKSNTAQVPRIVLPSVVGFNFASDAAAATGGIPVGGLYHSSGTLKIRLT